jgi:aspartyl-tRNA synthetase
MSEFVPPTEPVVAAEDEESKGPSKAELKRLAKKAEKEAKKAEHKASRAAESGVPQQVQGDSNAVDELAHLFADAELICSKEPTGRKFYEVSSLDESLVGQSVWIRARVHTTRAVGKGVFMLLRQSLHSVQAIAWQGERISKGFVKHTAAISLESVVDGKLCLNVCLKPSSRSLLLVCNCVIVCL